MAEYKIKGEGVVRECDGVYIPLNSSNKAWFDYQHWLLDGGVPDPEFTPEEVAANNAATARIAQREVIATLAEHDAGVSYGLPALFDSASRQEMLNTVQILQGHTDNPSDSPDYAPPLPPGVSAPPYKSFTVTVERIAGWQGNLGFKVHLESTDPYFTSSNLALAVYGDPDCGDYKYTTGAFVETEGVWGAVCPPGQEPGDVDVHFGILYGSAPMHCWTMASGIAKQTITAYEAEQN